MSAAVTTRTPSGTFMTTSRAWTSTGGRACEVVLRVVPVDVPATAGVLNPARVGRGHLLRVAGVPGGLGGLHLLRGSLGVEPGEAAGGDRGALGRGRTDRQVWRASLRRDTPALPRGLT